jgi:hypothetical protein
LEDSGEELGVTVIIASGVDMSLPRTYVDSNRCPCIPRVVVAPYPKHKILLKWDKRTGSNKHTVGLIHAGNNPRLSALCMVGESILDR